MKKIISLTLLFIFTFLTLVLANPCEDLSEQECLDNYDQGYQTSSECNSMYYCYPKYDNEIFQNCQIVTRTNFSSCINSLSTCYNNIAIDETKSEKCFCDEGTQFQKLDSCGITLDTKTQCLNLKTCEEKTRTYLGREIKYYENCEILDTPKDINCEKLTHTTKKCEGDYVVTYEQSYKPNECGTKCTVNQYKEIDRYKCDVCNDGKCTVKLEETKKTESSPIIITTKPQEKKEETITNTSNQTITIKNNITNKTKPPIFKNENKLEIKIKKNIPTETITIVLSFIALFLIGLLFLIKTN